MCKAWFVQLAVDPVCVRGPQGGEEGGGEQETEEKRWKLEERVLGPTEGSICAV